MDIQLKLPATTRLFHKLGESGFRPSGDAASDAASFYELFGRADILEHTRKVAAEAGRVAIYLDEARRRKAQVAAWFHDLGRVLSDDDLVSFAKEAALPVLSEELGYPALLHQKASQVIAKDIFGVDDEETLMAISCHTTLRRGAKTLDKVILIADKLSWESPDLSEVMISGLARSLDDAVCAYLKQVHKDRDKLKVVHPWLKDAYEELTGLPW